ncbi:MAG: hypothetical protein E3K32_08970 [wastewater metagenome]|nr:hypothetical protein [Candidatus Loosdrechtia aerotolerans]
MKNKYYVGLIVIPLFLITFSTFVNAHENTNLSDILLVQDSPGEAAKQTERQQRPKDYPDNLKLPSATGRPQYVLFKGKVKEKSVRKLEKFFREEVMPVIARDENILGLETYTNVFGCDDFKYVVLLKIRPDVSLSFDAVLNVFSRSKTMEESFKMINRLAGFFESSSTSIILHRPDLSISRRPMGYVQTIKK